MRKFAHESLLSVEDNSCETGDPQQQNVMPGERFPRVKLDCTSTAKTFSAANGESEMRWNPGPARRNPTQITAATCGRVPQFIAYTGNTDLAILLKDTFEPNPAVYASEEASM